MTSQKHPPERRDESRIGTAQKVLGRTGRFTRVLTRHARALVGKTYLLQWV